MERQEKLTDMVQELKRVFAEEDVDILQFKPNHLATLNLCTKSMELPKTIMLAPRKTVS